MPDTGWCYPASAGTAQDGGIKDWKNWNSVKVDDGSYADANGWTSSGNLMYTLWAKDFGFGIPSGATIDGIEVQVQAYAVQPSGYEAFDVHCRLYKGGSYSGSADRSTGALWTENTWVTRTYGGPADLWGFGSWTPEDLNSTAGFGFAFQPKSGLNTGSSSVLRVDFIRVKVYYTEAAGGTTHEAGVGLDLLAGALPSAGAAMDAAVAVGVAAGLSALTMADLQAAADLAAQAGLAPSAVAELSPAAVLAMAAGVAPSAVAGLLAGVTVAADLGMAFNAGAAVQEADLSFAVGAGLAPSVVAGLLSDVTLGADMAVAVDAGAAVREAALAIGMQVGLSPSATAVLAGTVTLTAILDLSAVTLAEFETAVVLDVGLAAAVQAGQDQEAAVVFGAALGAAVAATVAAGGIEAPARRTHRVEARGRTLHVAVRNRNRTV